MYDEQNVTEYDAPCDPRLPIGITTEQNASDIALLERIKREWREEGIL